jgi:hypothetical protein
LRGFLGNFPTLLGRQFISARPSATLPAQTPQFDGGGIPFVGFAVLDLAGRYVPDDFGKRDRIARAFETLRSHASIIAQIEREGRPRSRAFDFKLTHYPNLAPD